MAKRFKPVTPEQHEATEAARARLRRATDASLEAGLKAIEAGEDPGPAVKEASRSILHLGDSRLVYPDLHDPEEPGPTLDEATAGRPRLAAPGWTAERQRAFLIALAQGGCISHACAAVGLSRQSAYALRRREPHSVFAIAWDTAIQMSRQILLDEATERALAGREQDIWYRGDHVGTRVVHNDRLLMFLLAQKPEPAHPVLSPRELMQLWPTMLEGVDRVLPPPLSGDRLAELTLRADVDKDA